MVKRPIFIPELNSSELVREILVSLKWNPGFAQSQKEKNIDSLHEAARELGLIPLLEISSKSKSERGRHMSAFHMEVPTKNYGRIKLELAFQGSKVFQNGGPFTDLYLIGDDVKKVKRDERLKKSGKLIGFNFEGVEFPLEPKTAFYDWLYCSFLLEYRDWAVKLYSYAGFTDIEFNPYKSINCQARSAALFVSLMQRNQLDIALRSSEDFINILLRSDYRPQIRTAGSQAQYSFAS